jgi:AcrR family transcriptional regulator
VSKGEDTRREIVDRALALAGEVGLEGLTLGTLAADVKLSKSGLFAHFKSKETLQLEVLQRAIERFVGEVVMPALTRSRGEPRVLALFDRYLAWIRGGERRGGCVFIALSQEYDDRPGPVRDLLVKSQRDWHGTLGRAAGIAVAAGHFRADLDVEQFAYEAMGIGMAFQQLYKLLDDPGAETRARAAFEALVARSRRQPAGEALPREPRAAGPDGPAAGPRQRSQRGGAAGRPGRPPGLCQPLLASAPRTLPRGGAERG